MAGIRKHWIFTGSAIRKEMPAMGSQLMDVNCRGNTYDKLWDFVGKRVVKVLLLYSNDAKVEDPHGWYCNRPYCSIYTYLDTRLALVRQGLHGRTGARSQKAATHWEYLWSTEHDALALDTCFDFSLIDDEAYLVKLQDDPLIKGSSPESRMGLRQSIKKFSPKAKISKALGQIAFPLHF